MKLRNNKKLPYQAHSKRTKHVTVQNNITHITNCKYRTAVTLYTLETWFVSNI